MNARVAVENSMVFEDRIERIESDVGELKDDVKALNERFGESVAANAREFGGLRADMEKGFGALRVEIEKNRSDMEKGFGALRTEIERARSDMEKAFGSLNTSIESAKLWMLVTGVGSVILVTCVMFLGRLLKLF